jgi:hypothetical protein
MEADPVIMQPPERMAALSGAAWLIFILVQRQVLLDDTIIGRTTIIIEVHFEPNACYNVYQTYRVRII